MKPGDKNIIDNLRYRWPELCKPYTDEQLMIIYDDFSLSEDHGNNDENFPKWLAQ